MSRTRKIVTAPYRGAKALSQMVFRRYSWRGWGLPRTRFDYAGEVGDGTGSSTVMAPLLWIARNFPEAPVALWKLMGDGQEEQVTEHDMLRLLRRPNPFYAGTILWMATILDWFTDGNGYWITLRGSGGIGQPEQIWWAPSFTMEPKGDETTFITHYDYTVDGHTTQLDPDQVIHFRYGLDPEDNRKGRSPLKSVLREVFTDDEAANFTAALLRNMGVPGVVISPKGDHVPSDDDVKATKSFISTQFTADKRGEPLVMSGPTDVTQFGFSPEQLDLKALRRIPEERVTACLGVPAIVAGLGAGLDRSTFTNFGEAREAAYEENIIPAQRIIGEEMAFQLLMMFERDPFAFRVGFDTSKVRVLQDDENRKAERWKIRTDSGIATVNEARRDQGLDPVPGGDVFLRGYATLEVPTTGQVPEPPGPKRKSRGRNDALIAALDRDADALSAHLAGRLESNFDRLADALAARFEQRIGASEIEPELGKASNRSIADRILSDFQLDDWTERNVTDPIVSHYETVSGKTVDTVNQVLDLGVMIPDQAAQDILKAGGTNAGLIDVETETRDSIIRAIEAGRTDGEGPIQIARRIRDEVPKGRFVEAGSKYRAELIARAETKNAQNLSTKAAYRQSPNVTGLIAYDARVGDQHEPECEARAGQVFTHDEAEGEDLTHPNCSLSWAPQIAESLSD